MPVAEIINSQTKPLFSSFREMKLMCHFLNWCIGFTKHCMESTVAQNQPRRIALYEVVVEVKSSHKSLHVHKIL